MERNHTKAGFIVLLAVSSITAAVLFSGLEKEVSRLLLSFFLTVLIALLLALPFITGIRKDEENRSKSHRKITG